MKILTLKFLAFGPFSDRVFSLTASNGKTSTGGFHLFYGQNEAGKSSALRAIRQTLYGMDRQSVDAFLHPTTTLRLGAAIAPRHGEPFEFVRRKGDKNTLRQADDQTAFSEETLTSGLSGVDEKMFESMFGINHLQLRDGGREIIAGKGQLAETLFSAASGIANLQAVRKRLEQDCETIYKKSGRNQRIPELLKKLTESRKTLQGLQLPGEEWRRVRTELADAEGLRDEMQGKQEEARVRLARLTRCQNALLPVQNWKRLDQEWQEVAEAPELPQAALKRADEALEAFELQTRLLAGIQEELARLDEQLRGEEAGPAGMESSEIERLTAELGSHQKAQKDRRTLATSIASLEREAEVYLKRLGSLDSRLAETQYTIPPDRRARINKLGTEQAGFAEKRESLAQRLAEHTIERDQARKRLESLPPIWDGTLLQGVLTRIRSQGDPEVIRGKLAKEIESRRASLGGRLAKLAFWSGDADALRQIATPSGEQINRIEADGTQVVTALRDAQRRQTDLASALASLKARLQKLEATGSVPTEEDLLSARTRRDELWGSVRRHIEDKSPATAARSDLEAFEKAVQEADRLADRLRSESKRVAEKGTLLQEIARTEEQVTEADGAVTRSQTAQEAWETRWRESWPALPLAPGSPAEMRAWLAEREGIVAEAGELGRDEAELRECDASTERLKAELSAAYRQTGGDGPDFSAPLPVLLAETDARLRKRAQQEQQANDLTQSLAKLEDAIQKAEATAIRHDQTYREWLAQWTEAIRGLGLADQTTAPEALAVLEDLGALSQSLLKAEDQRQRIRGIDDDAVAFTGAVRTHCERACPEAVPGPVEEQMRRLTELDRAARARETRREALGDQRSRKQRELDEAQRQLSKLDAEIELLAKRTGQGERSRLRETIEQAERRSILAESRRQLAQQIDRLRGTATFEEFVEQVSALDPDVLGAQVQSAEDEQRRCDQELSRVNQQIGNVRARFELMDGKGDAADQASQCAAQGTEILETARQYAVLRLSAAVLQQGIERYRKNHEGPLLERASQLFAKFTMGSFAGLRPDVTEKGELLLVGLRADGKTTVPVEGMSDGTCDQLYLALRLAGLEAWIAQHGPMPFIVDDILVHFDDARSAATLEVLGELAERTQVLFFTHHERLVELARDVIPDDRLLSHAL